MASLKLNDTGTRCVLAQHQLTPARRIGRGQFCAVYEDGPDAVIKLTTDSIQLESVRDYLIGPHFPKMLDNYGYVGEQFSGDLSLLMFKSERLNPTRMADLATKRLVRKVMASVDRFWSSQEAINRYNKRGRPADKLASRSEATLEQLAEDTDLPLSVREAFQALLNMALNYQNIVLDMHGANLMVRGRDELIFNDVVVSGELLV